MAAARQGLNRSGSVGPWKGIEDAARAAGQSIDGVEISSTPPHKPMPLQPRLFALVRSGKVEALMKAGLSH